MRIVVPPLRERRDDIPLLVGHFLKNVMKRTEKKYARLHPPFIHSSESYHFPGNVRELENAILSAAVSASTDVIQVGICRKMSVNGSPWTEEAALSAPESYDDLRTAQLKMERAFIETLLSSTNGNVSLAAKKSGLNRTHLHEMCTRLGIVPSAFRNPNT